MKRRTELEQRPRQRVAVHGDDYVETRGRPTVYRPDYTPQLVHRLRLLYGANVASIAKVLGVAENTLRNWIATYPEVEQAWEDGGARADAKVADAYFRSATIGAEVVQEKLFYDAKRGEVVRDTYIERTPPSVPAMINWLANRQPKWWKTVRSATELSGPDGEPLPTLPPIIILEPVYAPSGSLATTIEGDVISEHDRVEYDQPDQPETSRADELRRRVARRRD